MPPKAALRAGDHGAVEKLTREAAGLRGKQGDQRCE
jgi:hypothetical protein